MPLLMPTIPTFFIRHRSFTIGTRVPSVGTYACDTCGTLQDFDRHEEFGDCEVCLNERTQWKYQNVEEIEKV